MKKNILLLLTTSLLFYACKLHSSTKSSPTSLDSYAQFFRTEFDIYTMTICQYNEYISKSEILTMFLTNRERMKISVHKKERVVSDKGIQMIEKDTSFYLSTYQSLRMQDFEYQLKKDSFPRTSPFYAGSGSIILISYNTNTKKYYTKHFISLYDELMKCE